MSVYDPLKAILAPLPKSEFKKGDTAILIVDMQYLDASPEYGLVTAADAKGVDTTYYKMRLKLITENIAKLLKVFREKRMEVIYCTIEALTKDGRDRSLEHKCVNLLAPSGSKDGEILKEIAPVGDEIVLRKTCSGVFNGTNIDQLLKNLGIAKLVVVGVVTNQCVDTAVRDASDRGYEVTLVEDGCAAFHESLHQASVEILGGVYCRTASTDEIIADINKNVK